MIVYINKRKGTVIGHIDFSDPINEYAIESNKRMPIFKKLGRCSVEVYGDEGAYPHFHIIGTNGDNICIALYINMYFSHGTMKYTQFSNSYQKEQLNEWLKLPNYKYVKDGSLTNYQALVRVWLSNNGNPYNFDLSMQPEYDKLNGEIKK